MKIAATAKRDKAPFPVFPLLRTGSHSVKSGIMNALSSWLRRAARMRIRVIETET